MTRVAGACILDSQLEACTVSCVHSLLALELLLGKSLANRARHSVKVDAQIDLKSLPGPSPGHLKSMQNRSRGPSGAPSGPGVVPGVS